MRILRFEKFLCELLDVEGPKRLYFEEVIWRSRMMGQAKGDMGAGAVIYGELTGSIMRICELMGVPFEGVPVSTIKKHATGKGNANKGAMVTTRSLGWCRPAVRSLLVTLKELASLFVSEGRHVPAYTLEAHRQVRAVPRRTPSASGFTD